jgi:chromosome partitioning protein
MPAKIIVVLNQKGGVGKTTLVCHLAYAAVDQGKSVLVVDFDTQKNATLTLAGSRDDLDETADQIFTADTADQIKTYRTGAGIHLLAGAENLDWLDSRKTFDDARGCTALVRSLPFDLIVFDTPPAIGLRHISPLLWANIAVVPTDPSEYATAGLISTLKVLHSAQTQNPRLQYKLVINRFKLGSQTHARVAAQLRERAPFSDTVLTERIAVSHALSTGIPIWNLPSNVLESKVKRQWRHFCEAIAI